MNYAHTHEGLQRFPAYGAPEDLDPAYDAESLL